MANWNPSLYAEPNPSLPDLSITVIFPYFSFKFWAIFPVPSGAHQFAGDLRSGEDGGCQLLALLPDDGGQAVGDPGDAVAAELLPGCVGGRVGEFEGVQAGLLFEG